MGNKRTVWGVMALGSGPTAHAFEGQEKKMTLTFQRHVSLAA